ncbi:AraC family transcriptional regulator [Maridesulfovibrio sp. FT414]|uniref:AraC family transcriptional regulator n=1 Tax=Maridesulfovibrio sp. FT414 TaxID=2979469 RepID=UPI003D80399F
MVALRIAQLLHAAQGSPAAEEGGPYISVGIEIDRAVLIHLVQEAALPCFDLSRTAKGLFVQKSDYDLLDAFFRLIRLLEHPERIHMLAPMIIREIYYLLLIGPSGDNLSLFHMLGYKSSQIAQAIRSGSI